VRIREVNYTFSFLGGATQNIVTLAGFKEMKGIIGKYNIFQRLTIIIKGFFPRFSLHWKTRDFKLL